MECNGVHQKLISEEVRLKSAEELFQYGQGIMIEMTNVLDGDYMERVERAALISNFEVCSVRVHSLGDSNKTFHALSECFTYVDLRKNPNSDFVVPARSIQKFGNYQDSLHDDLRLQRFPFFTLTYTPTINNETFQVSLGFASKEYSIMTQPINCLDCLGEDFCSQQLAEVHEEDWVDGDFRQNAVQIMEIFTSKWTSVLADFTQSFGTDFMYDEVPYILDQVYDSWDEIPTELESRYTDFNLDRNGVLSKDRSLCSKDECTDTADRGGLCYTHEDICRVHDCLDYKDGGAYCDFHGAD